MSASRLMRVQQVAVLCGVKPAAVYAAVKEGRLKARGMTLLGVRRTVIERSEALRWKKDREGPAEAFTINDAVRAGVDRNRIIYAIETKKVIATKRHLKGRCREVWVIDKASYDKWRAKK